MERMTILQKRRESGDENIQISRSEYTTKPYTFRSYHPKVLSSLPHGRGSCFTARLGRRCPLHTQKAYSHFDLPYPCVTRRHPLSRPPPRPPPYAITATHDPPPLTVNTPTATAAYRHAHCHRHAHRHAVHDVPAAIATHCCPPHHHCRPPPPSLTLPHPPTSLAHPGPRPSPLTPVIPRPRTLSPRLLPLIARPPSSPLTPHPHTSLSPLTLALSTPPRHTPHMPHPRFGTNSDVAVLRSGIDAIIFDMLRPLADAGVSPDVFVKFLLEIKSKTYFRRSISYLEELTFKREQMQLRTEDIVLFSGFANKIGYDGRAPSTSLLTSAYLQYHKEIRPYFDLELKKRGGQEYHVDVSYKVGWQGCR